MRTLNTTGIVSPEHTLTVAVPADILPGPCNVVVVLQDPTTAPSGSPDLQLRPHPVGLVDPHVTFRREDVYGDDGR